MQEAAKLAHDKVLQQLNDALAHMKGNEGEGTDNALIIDGKALGHALAEDARSQLLAVRSCLMSTAILTLIAPR